MAKIIWPGGTQLAPVPAVLAGCGDNIRFKYNLITLAWAGTVCSNPPMVAIGVRPERYSRGLIESSGEFTLNIPSANMAKKVDYCGMVSGQQVDKFKVCNLTPLPASKVKAPVVAQCPLVLECRVTNTLPLGSHILYLAEVVAVQVEDSCIDNKGKFDVEKANILGFAHGHYFSLGECLGKFGFSIQKDS